MQYFVYIGRHNKTIELFSKLSTGVFYAAPNCHKATKVLDKIREKYDAALFIEQIELSKISRISVLCAKDIRDFIWYWL